MVSGSEPAQRFVNCHNAALSVIPAVSELVPTCPSSSSYFHPISRAFTGNPPFPLTPESNVPYFKHSRGRIKGSSGTARL